MGMEKGGSGEWVWVEKVWWMGVGLSNGCGE